jgi:hypothetical protein
MASSRTQLLTIAEATVVGAQAQMKDGATSVLPVALSSIDCHTSSEGSRSAVQDMVGGSVPGWPERAFVMAQPRRIE